MRQFTQAYARASEFYPERLIGKVHNARIVPSWIGNTDTFWYRHELGEKYEYQTVDAETGQKRPAFDHELLAEALAAVLDMTVDADALPIQDLLFFDDGNSIYFRVDDQTFICTLDEVDCNEIDAGEQDISTLESPDSRAALYLRDGNIWMEDEETGERQLTYDAGPSIVYGLPHLDTLRVQRRRAGRDRSISGAVWSPNSQHVIVIRTDYGDTPTAPYVVEYLPPDRPQPVAHIAPLRYPTDAGAESRELLIIDTQSGTTRRIDLDSSEFFDYAPIYFALGLIGWDTDATEFYLVTSTSDARQIGVSAIDIETGSVRRVLSESDTHYQNLNPLDYNYPNVRFLPRQGQIIWWSERDGWGHLYRYDAASGRLINRITEGEWAVFDIVRIDEDKDEIFFTAGGREAGRNPYYRHLYRAALDGSDLTLITPEDADHHYNMNALSNVDVSGFYRISPSGRFVVDTYSTLSETPRTVIRRANGEFIAEVAKADASELLETGWRPPEPFVEKGADDRTDLYGAIFRPTDFDETRRYPIVEKVYAGPQLLVTPHSFMEGVFGFGATYAQAWTELGFVVIVLDGRGSPRRSREFHMSHLDTPDPFGLSDHVAAISNLASARPFIDLHRVAIVGTSFGGYSAARALLLYPDFFKAGIAIAAPQDFRTLIADTGIERFLGDINSVNGSGDSHYSATSNLELADDLSGALFLVHGEIDQNVPLNQPLGMIDALIRAGKDFEFLLVPNADHSVMAHPYALRRIARFLVDQL